MSASNIFLVILIAFVVSLIIVLAMKSSLRTARRNNTAISYVVENSFAVTAARDQFLYTERHEEKISNDDD